MSELHGDANWIDGCFEWYAEYAEYGGQFENTGKVYYNSRAGATTCIYGGNRLCKKAGILLYMSEMFL